MDTEIRSRNCFEKIMATLIVVAALIYLPVKILSMGYLPTDDTNRHIAFSMLDKAWPDVLVQEPGFGADHNAGWHMVLRFLNRRCNVSREGLMYFSTVGMFLLLNLTGAFIIPCSVTWFIVLLIIFIAESSMFGRMVCGRPFIVSCFSTLIILRLWFIDVKKYGQHEFCVTAKYLLSLAALTLGVWIHGTWYIFLIFPMAQLLAGNIKKTFELTLLIALATLLGAYMTGHFSEFLQYHFSAPKNIYSEQVFNWQLVTENGEGNPGWTWLIFAFGIFAVLIYNKRARLNELAYDPLFFLIMLTWLPAIKIIRFWADWGRISLMFWLCYKLTDVIRDMELVKKAFFRYVLFILVIAGALIIIPKAPWSQQKLREFYTADFTKEELKPFKPEEGGIVYNDQMFHFYFQFYNEPEGKYRYILGFESATMPREDKVVLRDLSYTGGHASAYKPWIDKLTKKDRIFASNDITKEYPQLDWVRASNKLWIGKLKENNG